MARILIQCPSCSEKGYIEISDEEFKNIPRGLLAVNIINNLICQHSFIAYIDKNLNIRDYFLADFHIEVPEIVPPDEIEEKEVPGTDLIDVFFIKINLPAKLITYILKSIFLKKKIAIILEQSLLKNYIHNLFNFTTQYTFTTDISIISKEEYKKDKKIYKEYMVFEGNKILNNFNNIIDPNKLKVERQIVKKFLSEPDSIISLIILKNEIHKVYTLSKTIADFVNNYKEKHKLSSKIIVDYISKVYNIVLSNIHFNFSIEIAKNYFGADISEFCGISDFLSFME
jgi:hypothetical protein